MKSILLLTSFFLCCQISFAQNLVSNPGFEINTGLPGGPAAFALATGWGNCNGGGSPDYFHTMGSGNVQLPNCFIGTVNPNTGDACMGAAFYYNSPFNFREYLSTQLISPLTIGQTYEVSFYITNGVTSGTYGGGGIDNIGAAFSTVPLTQPGTDPIPVTPQVNYGTVYYSYTWQLLTMQFVADSAYTYVTFGNFFPDTNTTYQQFDPCSSYGAYYFLDDIVVQELATTPTALFSAPNHICPGTCTDFTNQSLNATSYQWNFPGGNPSVSNDVSPTGICYPTPGVYDVELIATNSLSSDTLLLSNYLTVYPFPSPQGILQNGDTLFANQGAVAYQWYYEGNFIPGATDYYYLATQSGNFNVVATDENGCEVEAAILDVIASVQASATNDLFDIIYNAETKHLTISSKNNLADVIIFNSLGELVFETKMNRTVDVNCVSFPEGIYILQVKVNESVLTKQFLKN